MKKTKVKKIILLATLGMCIISFMPAVVGKADSRPIKDFTDTNNDVAMWADPQCELVLYPHGPPQVITDCIHSGSVLERDLKDGRILYKVNLHVKGALMLIFWYENEYWYLDPKLLFVGIMDYHFTATIIVYEGTFGGDIPNFWYIWFPDFFGIEPIGEGTFSVIMGSGTGIFEDNPEVRFTPGATAKVKLNQVGILKPIDHPQIDPEYDISMWPVEIVFFH